MYFNEPSPLHLSIKVSEKICINSLGYGPDAVDQFIKFVTRQEVSMRVIKSMILSMLLTVPVAAMAVDDQVNINTADVAELEKELTGVTEELARAIVAYRQKHGDFKSPEDLELVEGIGYDIVNINKDVIVVK